jgi:transcriptional regulator with XRE-family HTH domain
MSTRTFKRIGGYFRDARISSGMTQQNIADHLGYTSKQLISNWERGLCSPPMHQVNSLIKLFKLDFNEVLELFMQTHRDELCAILKIKRGKS